MFVRAFKAVFQNFRTKLLALVISLAIWFYADSRLTEQMVISSVDLKIEPPAGYERLYQSVTRVDLTVVGPRSIVTRLASQPGRGQLKLERVLSEGDIRAGGGKVKLTIEREWLRYRGMGGHPQALRDWEYTQLSFPSIEPRTVEVFASPRQRRPMRVLIRTTGRLPEGFRLPREPAAEPHTVEVEGPAVALDALDGSIPTADELALWTVRNSLQSRMRLQDSCQIELSDGRRVTAPLTLEVPSVLVKVDVAIDEEQPKETVTFRDIPVLWSMPQGFPYEMKPDGPLRVTVTVRGDSRELQKLTPASLMAHVGLAPLAGDGEEGPHRELILVQFTQTTTAAIVEVKPRELSFNLSRRPPPE